MFWVWSVSPKDFELLQKRRRIENAKEMLDNVPVYPTFIKRIIIGNEMWVYKYDVEIVKQSSVWRFKSSSNLKKCWYVFTASEAFFHGDSIDLYRNARNENVVF